MSVYHMCTLPQEAGRGHWNKPSVSHCVGALFTAAHILFTCLTSICWVREQAPEMLRRPTKEGRAFHTFL